MRIPPEVARFREVASEFCAWAEGPPADPMAEAEIAVGILASLIYHRSQLPGADPEDVDDDGQLEKGDSTLSVYRRFGALPFQHYSEVFQPARMPPEEPVTGDLADDLRDIYIDLKQGLACYEAGHPAHAVFHWQFTYGVHWGRHATSALRALHCYLTDPDSGSDGD